MLKPIIAITMGDTAGIGPEIIAKALLLPEIYDICRPLLIGDVRVLSDIVSICSLPLKINAVKSAKEGAYTHGTVDIIDMQSAPTDRFSLGEVNPICARAAYDYIKESCRLAMSGEVDAVATAPINKVSVREAGIPMIGHTEMFADICGASDPMTMFDCMGLRVFFLTRHLSLKGAISKISRQSVLDGIKKCDGALKSIGIKSPSIAVAALNPHGSDDGLFGDEEEKYISPAVKDAIDLKINAVGPIPADSVFHLGKSGKYDGILSLYHDQGHIATKTLDFYRTISVTLGLPFIRTSVDHGTAFDIAGKNIASGVSMAQSISLAAKYALYYDPSLI